MKTPPSVIDLTYEKRKPVTKVVRTAEDIAEGSEALLLDEHGAW